MVLRQADQLHPMNRFVGFFQFEILTLFFTNRMKTNILCRNIPMYVK